MGKHAGNNGNYGSTDFGAGAAPSTYESPDTSFEPMEGQWGDYGDHGQSV